MGRVSRLPRSTEEWRKDCRLLLTKDGRTEEDVATPPLLAQEHPLHPEAA